MCFGGGEYCSVGGTLVVAELAEDGAGGESEDENLAVLATCDEELPITAEASVIRSVWEARDGLLKCM